MSKISLSLQERHDIYRYSMALRSTIPVRITIGDFWEEVMITPAEALEFKIKYAEDGSISSELPVPSKEVETPAPAVVAALSAFVDDHGEIPVFSPIVEIYKAFLGKIK